MCLPTLVDERVSWVVHRAFDSAAVLLRTGTITTTSFTARGDSHFREPELYFGDLKIYDEFLNAFFDLFWVKRFCIFDELI